MINAHNTLMFTENCCKYGCCCCLYCWLHIQTGWQLMWACKTWATWLHGGEIKVCHSSLFQLFWTRLPLLHAFRVTYCMPCIFEILQKFLSHKEINVLCLFQVLNTSRISLLVLTKMNEQVRPTWKYKSLERYGKLSTANYMSTQKVVWPKSSWQDLTP